MNARWGMEKFAAANTEVILLYVTIKARTVSILFCVLVLPALSRLIPQASARAWSLRNEKKLGNKLSVLFCLSGMCLLQQVCAILYY